MEIVKNTDTPRPMKHMDYAGLAEAYNRCKVGDSVRTLEQVSNISQFKRALVRRGVASELDFMAYNSGQYTYVRKLTEKPMTKD